MRKNCLKIIKKGPARKEEVAIGGRMEQTREKSVADGCYLLDRSGVCRRRSTSRSSRMMEENVFVRGRRRRFLRRRSRVLNRAQVYPIIPHHLQPTPTHISKQREKKNKKGHRGQARKITQIIIKPDTRCAMCVGKKNKQGRDKGEGKKREKNNNNQINQQIK